MRHCYLSTVSSPWVFGVYLLLMGVLVWVPPGVPPQPRSDCGVMQGSLGRLFRSQAAVTRSQSSSAERPDAASSAALADHSAANGTSGHDPTVLVTESHKGAQEDANQDEWRFFFFSFFSSAHSALIRAFHLLWPRASPSTGRLH